MAVGWHIRPKELKRRARHHKPCYQQIWQAGAEAERQRIALDLHDTVIQTLYTANLLTNTLSKPWEEKPGDEYQGITELSQLMQRALDETRILLLELRSPLLAEKSLGALLHDLADSFTDRTHIPVTMSIEGDDPFLPGVQVSLCQIAREAFNNIAKHAQTSEAYLLLRHVGSDGKIVVGDRGRGFDPAQVLPGNYGLGIMRERAEMIGARVAIASEPDKGTEITISWRD